MSRAGLLVVVAVSGLLVGCDDDNPTSPSSGSVVVASAVLSPANEVPAIANAESVARGAAQITFNIARDAAGTITGATATMFFQLTDLPAGTTIRLAHIHSAVAGVNGPIVVDTGLTAQTALIPSDGRQEFTSPPISVGPVLMGQILANPSAYYFNVHTALNPGGLARGQLRISFGG